MSRVSTLVNAQNSPTMFVPPNVSVGQIVLWAFGPNHQEWSPALVLSVGNRTINLSVHVNATKDHLSRTGVRHCEDPFLKTYPQHDAGCWTLTLRDKAIDRLIAKSESGLLEED